MTETVSRPRPLVVAILDGWGISFVKEGNAIALAGTPNMDTFAKYYPTAAIQAAGIEVGLPWGEVGNSETGHRNIGAGQVQYQALPQIDKAIEDGSFFSNPVLLQAISHAKKSRSNLHLMGLVSPGGIHAHINHLFALLQLCAKKRFKERVFIHIFTDGRDAPPRSAKAYLAQLQEAIRSTGVGAIASVTGRFYSMDRNMNWDRTEAAYSMLIGGPRPGGAPSAEQAIEQAYQRQTYDEMIPPTAITRGGGPIAPIRDNDAIIFFNFRPDRARQLTRAFLQPDATGFTPKQLKNLYFVTMTKYHPEIPAAAAYVEEVGEYPLARVLSDAGLTQLHIAETEKYAHITYYLDVGHEKPFPNEDHVLIRSSRPKSFAEDAHMKAQEITDRVIQEVEKSRYDVIFINYANADMVGHTGVLEAAVEACQCVDHCLGQLQAAAGSRGGALIVTADHGNAEEMVNVQSGQVETDHSSNNVPFHYVTESLRRTTPKTDAEVQALLASPIGVLADIAPTILDILGIRPAPTMTGVSLLNSLQ